MSLDNGRVLVLNNNFQPINVCNVRRAFVLLLNGKAELVLALPAEALTTPTASFPAPSVIKLQYLVKRPAPRPRLVRQEVFRRDNFTCQYCGKRTRDLTIDHVVPRHRGGAHSWENLVSACRDCNHRKGGRTLAEARMHLQQEPREPRVHGYLAYVHYASFQPHETWIPFLYPNGAPPTNGVAPDGVPAD